MDVACELKFECVYLNLHLHVACDRTWSDLLQIVPTNEIPDINMTIICICFMCCGTGRL